SSAGSVSISAFPAATWLSGMPASIEISLFWSCCCCFWHPASARAPRPSVAMILAFCIGVARCRVALRTCQLAAVSLQAFKLVPGLSLSGEVERAARHAAAGVDVCTGHRARFVESQLAGIDDEQALGVGERSGAVRRRQAPAALQSGRNGNGPLIGRNRRRGVGIVRRRAARRRRLALVRGLRDRGHGIGAIGDRILPAAGGNRHDEGETDEGHAVTHAASTPSGASCSPVPRRAAGRSARVHPNVGMWNAALSLASTIPSGQRWVTTLFLVQKRRPSCPYWPMSPKPERFHPPKLW